jgi:hypothetical protein
VLEKFYILWKLYIWQLQCNSNSIFIPNHKPTVYPLSNQAKCSVRMTPAIGTWRQLNIFIDVLCPAVHSWLLTPDLLWCWRLTRPPLSRICAGVERIGATDVKGKHVGSFGSSGWLNCRHWGQCSHFQQYIQTKFRQHFPRFLNFLQNSTNSTILLPPADHFLKENINWWIYFLHFVQYLCSELESGIKGKELRKN